MKQLLLEGPQKKSVTQSPQACATEAGKLNQVAWSEASWPALPSHSWHSVGAATLASIAPTVASPTITVIAFDYQEV